MKKRGGKDVTLHNRKCVCVTDVFMNIHTHVSRQQKLKYKSIFATGGGGGGEE